MLIDGKREQMLKGMKGKGCLIASRWGRWPVMYIQRCPAIFRDGE